LETFFEPRGELFRMRPIWFRDPNLLWIRAKKSLQCTATFKSARFYVLHLWQPKHRLLPRFLNVARSNRYTSDMVRSFAFNLKLVCGNRKPLKDAFEW